MLKTQWLSLVFLIIERAVNRYCSENPQLATRARQWFLRSANRCCHYSALSPSSFITHPRSRSSSRSLFLSSPPPSLSLSLSVTLLVTADSSLSVIVAASSRYFLLRWLGKNNDDLLSLLFLRPITAYRRLCWSSLVFLPLSLSLSLSLMPS